MAAPVVVVFLCAAPVAQRQRAGRAGLPVAGDPDRAVHAGPGRCWPTPASTSCPANLENPLVLAGAVSLVCWVMMASLRDRWSPAVGWSLALAACVPVFGIAVWSPTVTAVLVAAAMLAFVGWPLVCRSLPSAGMWDQSLLALGRARFAGGPVLGSGG